MIRRLLNAAGYLLITLSMIQGYFRSCCTGHFHPFLPLFPPLQPVPRVPAAFGLPVLPMPNIQGKNEALMAESKGADGGGGDHHHHHHHHHHHQHGHHHAHDHNHGHNHNHDHKHGHDHQHEHGHRHEHDHNHGHNHNHDHKHGHDHKHEHGHRHGHGHKHEHDHKHGHDHMHGHDHKHGHDHLHDHSHGHDHKHDHSHGHDHKHDHGHSHAHNHGHHHSHGHNHNNHHTSSHTHGHDHLNNHHHNHQYNGGHQQNYNGPYHVNDDHTSNSAYPHHNHYNTQHDDEGDNWGSGETEYDEKKRGPKKTFSIQSHTREHNYKGPKSQEHDPDPNDKRNTYENGYRNSFHHQKQGFNDYKEKEPLRKVKHKSFEPERTQNISPPRPSFDTPDIVPDPVKHVNEWDNHNFKDEPRHGGRGHVQKENVQNDRKNRKPRLFQNNEASISSLSFLEQNGDIITIGDDPHLSIEQPLNIKINKREINNYGRRRLMAESEYRASIGDIAEVWNFPMYY